jgi:hypothetical protein
MAAHEPGAPPALVELTRHAASRLDAELAAARPIPDFSAMLARARELAPDIVSEADIAGALAPVIPLHDRRTERADAAALAPFIAALRAELAATLAARRMLGIPPPPLPC